MSVRCHRRRLNECQLCGLPADRRTRGVVVVAGKYRVHERCRAEANQQDGRYEVRVRANHAQTSHRRDFRWHWEAVEFAMKRVADGNFAEVARRIGSIRIPGLGLGPVHEGDWSGGPDGMRCDFDHKTRRYVFTRTPRRRKGGAR